MTAHISSLYERQVRDGATSIEGESQEMVDVLQKIVQNAGAILGVSNCSVALLDATGTSLVTLAALQHGRKPRRTRFHMSEGVAGWVAEHREALIINDVRLDSRFKRLGRVPVGSMVCVPLIDRDNFIGTLTVSSREINAFSQKKLHMLTIFAQQAVLAITNARQAELAQRQANQLEMLLDLSRSITTRLEADDLYRTILVDAQRLAPCRQVIMYRFSERTQELLPSAELLVVEDAGDNGSTECSFIVTIGDVAREKISVPTETSLASWAAEHRHPMLHAPVKFLPDESAALPVSFDCAELAAPFVSKNILYGVILLRRPQAFTSEELRLVRNFSNMAAAALENVELFHRVRSDQEQLRAIVAESSDGIAIIGDNGCFLEVNAAFGRIFGMEPEQIVGMECLELLGCDDENTCEVSREKCMIQRAIQEQRALSYIEVDLAISGTSRSLGLSVTPIASTGRSFCLMIARDVTAIRDATRMKANFLSMITHELRSPLNAINGYLDLTLTGIAGELNEQQRDFLQRARAGSEHLYALVEDLLLVSRADAGQMRLNRELTSIREIVANAVEELELMAKDNAINIEVDIAHDFPSIYADPVRIQQVLRNLLSNSLRFTPQGGIVTIAARVISRTSPDSPEEQEKVVEVEVRDTGYGIAPEHQQRIFERFYQALPSETGRSGGQGLGLAIVKMIVELHDGQVMVESAPGQGSVFKFTLPGLLS
ncbi:MAG TPA: ATP-binding protein [Ktedonobacteraceae bacterium]|jgi:PAS domain S-box-containing protein|nr:ATP-binding protein [Ktedonobacteraceae bacterium]